MRFHLGALAGRGAVARPGDHRPLGYQPSAFDRHPHTDGRAERPAGWSGAGLLQAGSYLTAVRTGEHNGYNRVVFQFSGTLPGYTFDRVPAVYSDPRGTPIPLAGQSYLRVVFHGCERGLPEAAAPDLHRARGAHAVLSGAADRQRGR